MCLLNKRYYAWKRAYDEDVRRDRERRERARMELIMRQDADIHLDNDL